MFTEQIALIIIYGLHLIYLCRLQVLSLLCMDIEYCCAMKGNRFHNHIVAQIVFTFQSEALPRSLPQY